MRAGPPQSEEAVKLRCEIDSNPFFLTLTPQALAKAEKKLLCDFQKAALLGDKWGVIEIPRALQSARKIPPIDIWNNLPDGVSRSSSQAKRIVLEIMRFAVAMTVLPSRTRIQMRHSSIAVCLESFTRIVRDYPALGRKGPFWPIISETDVTARRGASYAALFSVLRHYHQMGAIKDAPTDRPRVRDAEPPRDRTGEPEHQQSPRIVVPIKPYSDELVSAAGWAAIVMIRIIGPTLLAAVEAASRVEPRTHKRRGIGRLSASSLTRMNAEARDPIIAQWDWRGPDGEELKVIPIDIRFRQGPHLTPLSWPPKSYHHCLLLVTVLQGAHAFPLALSMGTRNGELLSMKIGMLKVDSSSGAVGVFHRWKMEPAGGRDTEAPVPSLVVEAIEQQERLARVLKKEYNVSSDKLWISTRKPGVLPSFGHVMERFFEAVSVSRLVKDGGANVHRFRKTLARIVALALIHAPKVLMDVFGHRDEEITIVRYILADPAILSDVQRVVREMVVLIAAEAVVNVDGVQGAGAPTFRARVSEYAKRAGRSALEPQSLLEFARALTQEGSSWAVISAGVICTNFTDGGLCNKGQGKANPHYCNPKCENQLDVAVTQRETVGAVVEAIESIDYMLSLTKQAIADGDSMMVAQFQGQIRSLLGRWQEVDKHFANNKILKSVLVR